MILPEYGGRLHQLFVDVDGREEPLLWSPDDVTEYAERPTRGGCFPMAPWPNRIRDGRFTWRGREYGVPLDGKPHAIHGRVHTRPWIVVDSSEVGCELRCGFDDGWPWPGHAEQRFELRNGALTLEMSVVSEDEAFPCGMGWHPWFRRNALGGEPGVTIPATERYELVDNLPTGRLLTVAGEYDLQRMAPLGERRLDDCYRASGSVEIRWAGGSLRIETPSGAPHVQVYTPPEAFCVEPQTCAPDAFNLLADGIEGTGAAAVSPGRPAAFTMVWRWSVAGM